MDRIMEESGIARESSLMEKLLKEIAVDSRAAYGLFEVRTVLDYGAIETVLIADKISGLSVKRRY